MYGILDKFHEGEEVDVTVPSIMRAEVVNTNDPDQMGKIQVHIVSAYSDKNLKKEFNFFPWASYASPFGGMDKISARGPGLDGQVKEDTYGSKSDGGIAYGMWGIPKVGAQVLVCSIDNDPNNLFWFGCIYPDSTPHTMPHGRYSTRTPGGDTGPDGPLNSAEQTIEPLYSNMHKAFRGSKDYEWRTRGADYQVAGITAERQGDEDAVSGTESKKHDTIPQPLIEDDGKTLGKDLGYRQGYSLSRSDPLKVTDDKHHIDRYIDTDNNLEPTTLSFTTPGFHAFAMDDRPENNRIRLRSSSGHQIIMDDTNERLYISSSEGRNWVEMDTDGHIYIYSQESISMRAEGDLNFSSGKTIRMTADQGIHMETPDEIRMHATKDVYVRGNDNLFLEFDQDINFRGGADWISTITNNIDIKASTTHVELSGELDFQIGSASFNTPGVFEVASSMYDLDSSGNIDNKGSTSIGNALKVASNIKSDGDITSSTQSLNALFNHVHAGVLSGPASTAPFGASGAGVSVSVSGVSITAPLDAYDFVDDKTDLAFWTNINPTHEPWARTFTKDADVNLTHTPELVYDDPAVGRSMKKVTDVERKRGALWHR